MSIKACIFDLDGTLLDTLTDLADSVNAALRDYLLPERSKAEIRQFVGNGVARLIARSVPENLDEQTVAKVFADFKFIYEKNKSLTTKPYPGIEDLLETLSLSGIRLAVLSNKADDAVQSLMKEFFPEIFEVIQGETPEVQRKPAPDGLLSIMKKMNLSPEEVIYIGDSEVDIETAQRADIKLVACSWGFRSTEQLRSAGAINIIETPQEVLNYIFNV